MGWPQDKFEFGAHDYRGGSDAPGVQEQVLANGTTVDSGNTHFIALVVLPCVSVFPVCQSRISITSPQFSESRPEIIFLRDCS
jgi:hypothetical protein